MPTRRGNLYLLGEFSESHSITIESRIPNWINFPSHLPIYSPSLRTSTKLYTRVKRD